MFHLFSRTHIIFFCTGLSFLHRFTNWRQRRFGISLLKLQFTFASLCSRWCVKISLFLFLISWVWLSAKRLLVGGWTSKFKVIQRSSLIDSSCNVTADLASSSLRGCRVIALHTTSQFTQSHRSISPSNIHPFHPPVNSAFSPLWPVSK